MKPYSEYTKDELMRILESLTPGGSEFHESPENCVRFVRGRFQAIQRALRQEGKDEPRRADLLAACENLLARLERVDPLPEGSTSSMRDYARAAIAAAKGGTNVTT